MATLYNCGIRIWETSYLNPRQSHETTIEVSQQAADQWFIILSYGYQLESQIYSSGRIMIRIINSKTDEILDEVDCGLSEYINRHISCFLVESTIGSELTD